MSAGPAGAASLTGTAPESRFRRARARRRHHRAVPSTGADAAASPSCSELIAAEWGLVLESARRHGVGPLLYGMLCRHGLIESLPPRLRTELKAAHLHSAAYVLRRGRIRPDSRDDESPRDIMVVKGPALGPELYADSAQRPYGDFDFVLREECWPAFREVDA